MYITYQCVFFVYCRNEQWDERMAPLKVNRQPGTLRHVWTSGQQLCRSHLSNFPFQKSMNLANIFFFQVQTEKSEHQIVGKHR